MRPGGYLGTAERWSLMDDLCFFFVSYREDKQDNCLSGLSQLLKGGFKISRGM